MNVKIVIPKSVSYTKAIQQKCLDCCCGVRKEVRDCTIFRCPLFPYRFGMRPDSYINKHPNTVVVTKEGRRIRKSSITKNKKEE